MLSRRGLLVGGGAAVLAVTAPAIVSYGNIMPVRSFKPSKEYFISVRACHPAVPGKIYMSISRAKDISWASQTKILASMKEEHGGDWFVSGLHDASGGMLPSGYHPTYNDKFWVDMMTKVPKQCTQIISSIPEPTALHIKKHTATFTLENVKEDHTLETKVSLAVHPYDLQPGE